MADAAAGADSALLTRPGLIAEFKANLGVVVTAEDQEKFASDYAAAINKACKNQGMVWKRPLGRAADIRYFCGSDSRTANIIKEVLDEVSEAIKKLHIVYTMIFPSKVKQVYMYNAEHPVVRMSPLDFQDRLEHPYPYLSLWAYLRCLPGLKRPLLTDGFGGELTMAWQELSKHSLKVYFNGANTNPLISMADMLIRLLNARLESVSERLPDQLTHERLPTYLPELSGRIDTLYLGQKFLKEITPLTRERIDTSPFVAHPVFFIVKEPTSVQTSDFITRAPVMDAVFHVAFQKGGCTKFFEATSDQKLIQPGDYFLWTGEHGKRFVESLRGTGYKELKMGSINSVTEIAA